MSEQPRTEDPMLGPARAFVARVQALDRAELASLKRNAGRTLGEARGAHWFYRLLDDHGWRDPEIHFLVATLVGLNQPPFAGDFGKTMRCLAARQADGRDLQTTPAARRFAILLDAEFERVDRHWGGGELAWRLRQTVRLAASHEVGVDWPQLLVDLRQWQRPGRPVRRRWAESFYASPNPNPGQHTTIHKEASDAD